MKGVTGWLLQSPGLRPGLLVVLCLLTACDATQWPLGDNASRPVTRQSAATSKSVPATATAKTQSKAAAGTTAAKTSSAAAAPAVASIAAPPPVVGEGGLALTGLDAEQARAMLGPPAEEETRTPAKIWRYRYAQCTLDVALYPDVQTHEFRVLNYEVNGNDGTEQGRRQCIAGLRSGVRAR